MDRGDDDFKFHWTENEAKRNVPLNPRSIKPKLLNMIHAERYDRTDDLNSLQVNVTEAIVALKK